MAGGYLKSAEMCEFRRVWPEDVKQARADQPCPPLPAMRRGEGESAQLFP
jgi:hypothetical protein